MDRNTIIGLVLIAGIVFTWSTFFTPDPPKKDQDKDKQEQVDSTAADSQAVAATSGNGDVTNPDDPRAYIPVGMDDSTFNALSDSAKEALINQRKMVRHGAYSPLYEGEEEIIEVETDKMLVKFTTKGGYVKGLYFKDYKTYGGDMQPLLREQDPNMFYLVFKQIGTDVELPIVETKDLYFTPSQKGKVKVDGSQKKELVFTAKVDSRHKLEFVYTFENGAYEYGFEIRQTGMKEIVAREDFMIKWLGVVPKTEKAMELMRAKTAVYFRESGDVEALGFTDTEPYNDVISVDWVAFKSQFFTHTLMTKDEKTVFKGGSLRHATPIGPDPEDPNSGDIVKLMSAELPLDFEEGANSSAYFTFVASPLDYDLLADYERDMTGQLELGWGPLKYVNMYLVIPLFNLLEGMISNYGIIILLLAFIIKMLIYPLTYKTYISTAKMRIINQTPEVKELEEKYKDDSTKLQQAKMGIYKQMGVSMLGGCWPMLLQYPFLIALFFFFPNSIELRQESFLWAEDLSTYDSILDLGFSIPWYGDHVSLFTLLMTASIFIFTLINQRAQGTVATNPVMKYFPYIMPLIFLGFLNSYSSGLSWYYLLSNLISISQTLVTKRFIDEEKLLTQMRENAKKKKKSGKKGRLERWMEEQQKKQQTAQASGRSGGGNGGSNRTGGNNKRRR